MAYLTMHYNSIVSDMSVEYNSSPLTNRPLQPGDAYATLRVQRISEHLISLVEAGRRLEDNRLYPCVNVKCWSVLRGNPA